MDGAISPRKFPAYTTAQLESAVAAGRGTEAMIQEIADRKAGKSVAKVIPQLVPAKALVPTGEQGIGFYRRCDDGYSSDTR